MPLLHSSSPSAFRTNVETLMGEVGKSPHVQSRSQALAIAYATKRRGRAEGGAAPREYWPGKFNDISTPRQWQHPLTNYYVGKDADGYLHATPSAPPSPEELRAWQKQNPRNADPEELAQKSFRLAPRDQFDDLFQSKTPGFALGGGPSAPSPVQRLYDTDRGFAPGGFADGGEAPGLSDLLKLPQLRAQAPQEPPEQPIQWGRDPWGVPVPLNKSADQRSIERDQDMLARIRAGEPWHQAVVNASHHVSDFEPGPRRHPEKETFGHMYNWPKNLREAEGGPGWGAAPVKTTGDQMARGGIAGFAPGGFASPSPSTPWQVRAEARGMHTGPILSAVAGRTDHHPMSVPAGAYVLPADHVSSMGQGNTVHGMAVLNKMFHGGPYGGAPMGMRSHGMKMPRAPLAHFAGGGSSDAGGARGAGSIGKAVPINAAGGEFVIPPEVVAAIGGGNIKHGHQILDHWVISNRRNHINTLRKLPGPAKS